VQYGEENVLIAAAGPALLAEVLDRFGEVRLRATGTSMLPAIRAGDILVVRRCAIEDFVSGDVVLFRSEQRLFAHRVTRKQPGAGAAVLITKGDALSRCDPPVDSSQVLGRVTAITTQGPVSRARACYSRIGSVCRMATREWAAALGRLRLR
jgi:signal peptidase I